MRYETFGRPMRCGLYNVSINLRPSVRQDDPVAESVAAIPETERMAIMRAEWNRVRPYQDLTKRVQPVSGNDCFGSMINVRA